MPKTVATAALIVLDPNDKSLAGAKKLVQQLHSAEVTSVTPIPGKPVGTHIEDMEGTNIGLSGLQPPIREGTAVEVRQLNGLRAYTRLGPDLPSTSWAAVVDLEFEYEHE